jgi:hypothetical protein
MGDGRWMKEVGSWKSEVGGYFSILEGLILNSVENTFL